MGEAVHYASDHQEALAAWDEAVESEQAFRDAMAAAEEELGRRLLFYQEPTGEPRVAGMEGSADDVPDGWRYLKTKGFLKPAQGKAGKEARELLARLSAYPSAREVLGRRLGIPDLVFLGARFLRPGVDRFGDRVFVSFSSDPEVSTGEPFERPTALDGHWPKRAEYGFERVRNSEYHLAREEHEGDAA